MPPKLLQLEITENMVMQNVQRATNVLGSLEGRGVRLAMDDFGIGYSCINQFPVDALKIDRSVRCGTYHGIQRQGDNRGHSQYW